MLQELRVAMLVFLAMVLVLAVLAMPAGNRDERRRRALSCMLLAVAYLALVGLYYLLFGWPPR